MPRGIQPTELATKLAEDPSITLIDVRTPAEFGEAHVVGARNVPLSQLDPAGFAGSAGTIYLICQSGARGLSACHKLESAGLTNVCNVEGGTRACIEAGLPIARGKQAVSLERQVRIAAGTLVVIGTALAALVHPYWLALPGFVGAGLVFAGLTDTCGMGMLLARMPWNQRACGT